MFTFINIKHLMTNFKTWQNLWKGPFNAHKRGCITKLKSLWMFFQRLPVAIYLLLIHDLYSNRKVPGNRRFNFFLARQYMACKDPPSPWDWNSRPSDKKKISYLKSQTSSSFKIKNHIVDKYRHKVCEFAELCWYYNFN